VNNAVAKRIEAERAVIRGLIRHLKTRGFALRSVDDGEERVKCSTADDALEVVFSVDECRIYFTGARIIENALGRPADTQIVYGVLIVLGNADDGSEVIADYSAVSPFSEAVHSYIEARHFI